MNLNRWVSTPALSDYVRSFNPLSGNMSPSNALLTVVLHDLHAPLVACYAADPLAGITTSLPDVLMVDAPSLRLRRYPYLTPSMLTSTIST